MLRTQNPILRGIPMDIPLTPEQEKIRQEMLEAQRQAEEEEDRMIYQSEMAIMQMNRVLIAAKEHPFIKELFDTVFKKETDEDKFIRIAFEVILSTRGQLNPESLADEAVKYGQAMAEAMWELKQKEKYAQAMTEAMASNG
jgi:hypothetical protein